MDVGNLSVSLGITPSRTSQHLRLLRAHRVVDCQKSGRYRLYRLVLPDLARWLRQVPVATADARVQSAQKSVLPMCNGPQASLHMDE